MTIDHEFLVSLAKQFGLFYLMALAAVILVWTYWPKRKKRLDEAARSILEGEDRPCR